MTRADRKYLAVVIAALVLLALAVAGALAYKPLRLKYAIYKVRSSGYVDYPGIRPRPDDRWLRTCLDAARNGNRQAMEFLIERARLYSADVPVQDAVIDAVTVGTSCLFLAAAAQPDLFAEILNQYDDQRVKDLIEHVTLSCMSADLGDDVDAIWDSIRFTAKELEDLSQSSDPEVRRVARATLEFLRRRFAKELVEAEAKKKESAP